MSRQTKTPRQRAEEALAIEERRVERLTAQWTKSRAETERLAHERDDAMRRRDYLRQHPDLQHTTTATSTGDPA